MIYLGSYNLGHYPLVTNTILSPFIFDYVIYINFSLQNISLQIIRLINVHKVKSFFPVSQQVFSGINILLGSLAGQGSSNVKLILLDFVYSIILCRFTRPRCNIIQSY